MKVLALLLGAILARPLPPPPPAARTADDALLSLAAQYVDRFEQAFSTVLWRERYTQEVRIPRQFAASGTRYSTLTGRRVLDSELLLVWLPREATWLAVRDVMSVDGAPRSAEDRARFSELVKGTSVSVSQLRALAAENGRFNLGRILRTFNEPTLALQFFGDRYRPRFSARRTGTASVDGRPAVTYAFDERAKPTVIQNRDRDLPVSGTVWLETSTGRVLQTALKLSDPVDGVVGQMVVVYRPQPAFEVLVPVEMRETYTSNAGEEVAATATYSEFRRFETFGRLIVPG